LRSIVDQTTITAKGWRSKIKENKGVAGMVGGMAMDRASSSKSRDRTSKYSTLSTKSQANKASLPHSPKVRPQLRGSTKARAMTKEETRTRTRDKGSGSSTVSSMEKKKGTSPKIAQTLRKPKKESRVE
jgi:hypothetical protein